MNIFSAIIESILSFIRNNPLTVLFFVMLAVFAPSLFGSLLIGLLIFGIIIMAVPLFMFFKLYRMSRKVEQQAKSQQQQRTHYYTRQEYSSAQQQHTKDDGEVKVYTTSSQQQKRVSEDVGDYIDFKEVKK